MVYQRVSCCVVWSQFHPLAPVLVSSVHHLHLSPTSDCTQTSSHTGYCHWIRCLSLVFVSRPRINHTCREISWIYKGRTVEPFRFSAMFCAIDWMKKPCLFLSRTRLFLDFIWLTFCRNHICAVSFSQSLEICSHI